MCSVDRPRKQKFALQAAAAPPSHEVGLVCGGFVFTPPPVAKLIAINQRKSMQKCRIQVVKIKS